MFLPHDQPTLLILRRNFLTYSISWLLPVVDEGGPLNIVGHAPPSCFCQRINVVILRTRPHYRLVTLVFFCRWFIIVVICFTANSARTTCIARLLH